MEICTERCLIRKFKESLQLIYWKCRILPDQSIKEKAATVCQLFQSMAEQRNITLKLRKVTKEK